MLRDVEMDDEDDDEMSTSEDEDQHPPIESLADLMDVVDEAGMKEDVHRGPDHGVDGLSDLHVLDVKIDAGDDVKLAGRVSSIISGMIVVAVRHHQ